MSHSSTPNLIIKHLSPNDGNIENSTMKYLSKRMKMSSESVKNQVERITKLGSNKSMVKVQFKHPFKRSILNKNSQDQISCHQDLNLETRVKRSILWNIGKLNDSFSFNTWSL